MILGAALFIGGLVLAAFIAADLVAANARDLPINSWFWNQGQQFPWLLSAAQGVSWIADGPRNIIIVTVVSIGLLIARQWRWALFLVVVSQVGVIASNLLKFSIARERPPFIENTDLQQHLSFPSGHTFAGFTVWVAMALIAWYLLPKPWASVLPVLLVVVGMLQAPARLLVGKHWVTDVIGSWLLGAGWLLVIWGLFLWWWAPRTERSVPAVPKLP